MTRQLLLHGNSGFATPDLYTQCEQNRTSHVIRLKENNILREQAAYLADELTKRPQSNKADYAVIYGEFMYKAGPWPYERRVVCSGEARKPNGLHVYLHRYKHGFLTRIPRQILL